MPSHRVMQKKKKKRDLCVNPSKTSHKDTKTQRAARGNLNGSAALCENCIRYPSNQPQESKKWNPSRFCGKKQVSGLPFDKAGKGNQSFRLWFDATYLQTRRDQARRDQGRPDQDGLVTIRTRFSRESAMNQQRKIWSRSACLAILIAVVFIAGLFCASNAPAQTEPPVVTLEEAIRIARDHSYQRKAAQYRVESARQDSHSAWAEMMPSLRGEYSYARLKNQPYMRAGNTELLVGPNDNFHWDVSIIQPLFTGFALTSQLEIRELTVAVREQEARSASLDVRRDAQLAYFDLLLARKLREVAGQTVTALEAQEQDAKRFFEQELIPLNDLLRSQVALSDATQSLEKAEASVRLAQTRLNLLLGRPADEALTTADIDDIPPYQAELDALTAKALEARPDIRAARLGLDTLKKAITAAKSPYYPQVGAFANYEQDGDNFAADSNDYSNEQNASAGIKLEWEIFDWGKTRSKVAKNKAELRAAEQRLKMLEDGVRLEVQSAFLDLQVARKNTGTAQNTLAQARENRRIVKLRYDQQIATSTDVLNAQTDLTRADTNYYRALYGYMMSLANLERAVANSE